MATRSAQTPLFRPVPLPRVWGVRPGDVAAILVGNGILVVGMWIRHGSLDQLGTLGGSLTAIGQVTGLLGAYAALVQLVLMARLPWLDEALGPDRLAQSHRWLGFATVWLLMAHGVFTTVGYAIGDRASVPVEAWTLLTTYPYVLLGTAGMALFVVIAVSSVRAARRRMSYETWYGLHLYAYLAIALAFGHQLAVGADFVDDPVARGYWIAMYVVTGAAILAYRVGQPIRLFRRHGLRVANVVRESPDVVSIYVTGRDLHRLPTRAGQFFIWRFLTRDEWWRAHPFSLSAAPNGTWLRTTVKALGDDSARLQRLAIGTPVFLEGPYGILTGARRQKRKVLLVAGGIGITPLRALLEELPARPGELTLLYRARRPEDLVFRTELDHLADLRGARVLYVVGPRRQAPDATDPLSAAALVALVPDIADHDVYLCGPTGLTEAVRIALRSLHVPPSQIHSEQFGT